MSDCQNLITALIEAKKEFKTVKKSKKMIVSKKDRPVSYADLSDLYEATEEALAKHGLTVVGFLGNDGDRLVLNTTIFHVSGERVGSSMEVPKQDGTPQRIGASISYMKRYQYSTLLSIVGEEDLDGEEMENLPPSSANKPSVSSNDTPDFLDLMTEQYPSVRSRILEKFGTFASIPLHQLSSVIQHAKKMIEEIHEEQNAR